MPVPMPGAGADRRGGPTRRLAGRASGRRGAASASLDTVKINNVDSHATGGEDHRAARPPELFAQPSRDFPPSIVRRCVECERWQR